MVEVLAFIGGSAIMLAVFVAVHGLVKFLQHTRKIAGGSAANCRRLDLMLSDTSRRVDSLARDVHLLKDNHKESS